MLRSSFSKLPRCLNDLACEQALLFGRVKNESRENARARDRGPLAASPLDCMVCALRNFVKKYNRLLIVYSRSGNEVVSKTKHSKTKTEARSTQNSKPVCPLKSRDSPLSSDQCWYSRITNRLQFKTIQVELRGAANAFPPPWTKFKKWRPPVLDVIKVYYWLPFSLGQTTSWTFFLRFSLQN